jgi:imidazolonepropionase-like amidohydrolase
VAGELAPGRRSEAENGTCSVHGVADAYAVTNGGVALPGGDVVDLFADGDRWTDDPDRRAGLAAEGWLLPGLVDAHTHPGADEPGKPLDEAVLRDDLRKHVAAGVTMIRSPGLAGEPPAWVRA